MRHILSFVVVAAAGLGSCGPRPAPIAPVEAVRAAERPLLLWEARKGDRVSHLLGTCHLPIPLDHVLPAPHDAALRGARVLLGEADLQATFDPVPLIKLMWDPARDLRAELGPEVFAPVAWRMRASPAPMLAHTPPWLLSSMVWAPALDAGSVPVDLAIASVAREAGVSLAYLETAAEQQALLDSMNQEFIATITAGSDDAVSAPALMAELWAACLAGDIAAVDRVLATYHDASTDRLLAVRNVAWRDRVLAEAEAGGAFVAVGAGHLVGPTGLLEQLRADGFVLTPQTTSAPPTADPERFRAPQPLEPVAFDTARIDAWARALDAFPRQVCADPQQSLRQCFVPTLDQAGCEQRVAADLRACVEQHAPGLPEPGAAPAGGEPPEVALRLCALSGLPLAAIATDTFGTGPVCDPIRDNLLTAMAAAQPH